MRSALVAPLVALSFLTLVPGRATATPTAAFPRAVAFFPLVGAALGLVVAAFDLLARSLFAAPIVGALDLALLAIVSGGLHLDGLADASDALLPAAMSSEERLSVMRSGAVGAFGAAAVVLALLVEFGALAALAPPRRGAVLVASVALSRWSMAVALGVWPYVRPVGLGRAFKDGLGALDVALGSAIAIGVAVAVLEGAAVAAVFATLLVTLVIGALAVRRIGGVTGDVCGAIGELAFAASLVAIGAVRS